MREEHDHLCAFRARRVGVLLERLLLDAEGPLGHEVTRVRDRRVGKRLADDRHRHPVRLVPHPRHEHRVAEVGGADVLRDELDAAAEIACDRLLHALGAVGELPVRGHDIDAELALRRDHVRAFRPQREPGALPAVAAIEQQRAGALAAHAPDQGREMCEPSHLAVGACRALEVERGEGVRLRRARLDAERLEQALADQVRRPARRFAHADVHARLAKPEGCELRVRIGEVEQRDVAGAREAIERIAFRLAERLGRIEREPHCGRRREHLEELAPVHRTGPGPITSR